MKKIKIIYILGTGNSGSTLLGMALGAHSKMFCAGELDQTRKKINDENSRCSCGAPVLNCDFWENFKNIPSKPNFRKETLEKIWSLTQQKIIIDTSKNIERWHWIENNENIDAFLIYLVRDGRAYINSRKKDLKRKIGGLF